MASYSVAILLLLLTIAALLPWTGACASGTSEADGRSQCADYCHGFANASRNIWGAKCVRYNYQYDWQKCHVQCQVVTDGAGGVGAVYEYFPICKCQTSRDRCAAGGKTYCSTTDYYGGLCCTSSERCEAVPNKAPRCISMCAGVNCGAHGSCVATTGKCACTDGWRGTLCATAPSECYGVKCGAHGSCSPANGVCICRNGYSGVRCQKPPAVANKPNLSGGGGAGNCKRMMCRAENDETVERADASNSGGTIHVIFYFQSQHICLLYWFIVSGGAVAGIVIACVVVVVIVLVAALTFVLVRRRQASAQAESNYDTMQ